MKRIIDMLLKMIWPAFVSFILLMVEVFIFYSDIRIFSSTSDSVEESKEIFFLIEPAVLETVIALSLIATVVFSIMFVTGVIWNIVYSLKHGDKE